MSEHQAEISENLNDDDGVERERHDIAEQDDKVINLRAKGEE